MACARDAGRSVVTTLAILTAVASLNHAFKHKPSFYGLEHLTHWFLLLTLSAAAARARWWTAVVSSIGVVVLLLHWSLVFLGVREHPNRENASHNLLCYLALPLLVVAAAASSGAYAARLTQTVPSLAVFVAVYACILCTHDARFPHAPAYARLPLPTPAFAAASFLLGTLFLAGMHWLRPRLQLLSLEW